MSARVSVSFDVHPRYAGGSPAQVTEAIAERVAAEELDHYRMAQTGFFGALEAARAQELGLEGIAEERRERAGGFEIRDLISDRRFFRLRREPLESDRRWLARIESARQRYRSAVPRRRVQALEGGGR